MERLMGVRSEASTTEFARLGRIVAVTGGHAIILLDNGDGLPGSAPVKSPEIGTLLKVDTAPSIALALVSALSAPMPSNRDGDQELRIVEVEFIGELPKDEAGVPNFFRRGISCYPSLGDVVSRASKDELAMAYACDAESSIRIGTIQQDSSIPAMVKIDELLGKHFAVLGTTGTGKSCSVALVLRRILEKNPQAHILLLDLHREYAASFREYAELVQPDSMNLPFWLLNFDEIVEILIGMHPSRETDIEILRELIPIAKQRYMSNARRDLKSGSIRQREHQENNTIGVDTPVPYRASDLMALLDEQLGRLDMKNDLAPYKRLKARLDTVSRDQRYQFMFGSLTVQDTMAQVLGRLFRIPVDGKPITILELGGLPSEVINVVVSVLARLAFDFGLWSGGRVPITFVCEEAHRYVPIDRSAGFEPTKRAISRIAKEGRKYGVSLCIVSQRPAELDPTILSQCNTIFSMRLTNERDQEILKAGISDTAASLLEFMPTMGTGEAISFGEGVALPTRIKFDMLPPSALPRSATASFTGHWSRDVKDENFLADVVARWRNQALGSIDTAGHGDAASEPAPPTPAPLQPAAAPPVSPGLTVQTPRFGQAAAVAAPQRPLPGQPIPAQSQSPSSIRNQAASQPQSLAALLRQLKPN
jgi:DNA helicase HerA-like ATPase